MNKYLNEQDLDLILESLKYSKLRFEEFKQYSSYEFKLKRIDDVEKVIAKVKVIKQSFKKLM